MRWIFFAMIALLMGIQSLRAEDEGIRSETRFLRVACSVNGSELSVAYFAKVDSLQGVLEQYSARMAQFSALCSRKSKRQPLQWATRVEQTPVALGRMNEACSAETDCEQSLACHEVTGRCIPAINLANLPLTN